MESAPWSKCYADCANCGTTSVPHHAGGFCRTCYPFHRKRQEIADTWAPQRPDSFPRHLQHQSEAELREIKRRCIDQIRGRLARLQHARERIEGRVPVTAIELEYAVRRVAVLLGGSFNTGSGSVSFFQGMDEQTRRGLFVLLSKLERCRRERVINWCCVFRDLHESTKEDRTGGG